MINFYYYTLIITTQLLDGILSIYALTSNKFNIYEINPVVLYLLSISPYLILLLKVCAIAIIIGLFIIMKNLCYKHNKINYYKIGFNISIFTMLLFSFVGFFTGIYTYLSYYTGVVIL